MVPTLRLPYPNSYNQNSPTQDALERNLHELKEKEKTISKQNEIVEAIERANAHLNEECMRNKEKLAQSQVHFII